MTAQSFDLGSAQASVGEGVDERIEQGNKLGVIEGLLVVVAEPVSIWLMPKRRKIISVSVAGWFSVLGRGGWTLAVAVAPRNGGNSSPGRQSVMLRAWPGTREISPRRSRVKII
jgi:hypothetical protein